MRLIAYFTGEWITYFFLLTPFVVLSAFISFSQGMAPAQRRRCAGRFFLATVAICAVLFGCGNYLFRVMAISVDSFRVGAGALLFLNAITLARGQLQTPEPRDDDFAVVPLALPIAVGPGTIGTLLVMRASATDLEHVSASFAALIAALGCVFLLLLTAERVERRLGRLGLSILSRITGLVLAAFAAQLILAGVSNTLLVPD